MQLIHVGYPKCASTSLQDYLFNNPSLGFRSPYGAQCIRLLHDLAVIDTFEFDRNIEQVRESYQEEQGETVSVYSHESLLVDPYGGRSQVREGVRRLKELFKQPKILLVIREQKAAIVSSYNEHLRRGYSTTFEAFVNQRGGKLGYRTSVCKLDEFKYDGIISLLHQVFDKENVIVLPMEMIRSPDFLERLYIFLDRPQLASIPQTIPVHSRKSRKGDLVLLRHLNKLICPSPPSSGSIMRKGLYFANMLLSPLIPGAVHSKRVQVLRSIYDLEVSGRFTESNRRASELIGIDLAKYGYE